MLGVTGHFFGAVPGVYWSSKEQTPNPHHDSNSGAALPRPCSPSPLYESVPSLRVLTAKPEVSQTQPVLPVVSTLLKATSPHRTVAPGQASLWASYITACENVFELQGF